MYEDLNFPGVEGMSLSSMWDIGICCDIRVCGNMWDSIFLLVLLEIKVFPFFSFVLSLFHVVVQRIFLVSWRNGFYCCCWFSVFLFLFLLLFLFWVLCNVWQKQNKTKKIKV